MKRRLDKLAFRPYNIPATEYLIKSGGGTGPMMPGNRQQCMVPNPAAHMR